VAIDLFCYCSLDANKVGDELELMAKRNPDLFSGKFLISAAKDLASSVSYYDLVEIEISRENGLAAQSSFIVSLNDKRSVDLLPVVEKILKNALGEEKVLLLLNNEERR